jgi:long-chain acyl-CoA synthetase
VDEEGYIFVVDRKADFIKSFGFRVSSQEVETCVLGIPEIVSAAAVGVPDLVAGEAIYVFITVRSGATVSEEAVIQHCGERLARHMVPQAVRVIKQMPLNAHGKVVKTELRKLAAEE